MTKPSGQKLSLNALLSEPIRDHLLTPSPGSHATSVSLDTDSLKSGPIGLHEKHRKISVVVKTVAPAGERIVILNSQTVRSPWDKPSYLPRHLGFWVSDHSARDLLMKSRLQLRNLYPQVNFHFYLPKRERQKMAEARRELKVRILVGPLLNWPGVE